MFIPVFKYDSYSLSCSHSLPHLRSELDAARVACRAAEDLAERRTAEVKKLQQAALGAEALRKYQDICLVRSTKGINDSIIFVLREYFFANPMSHTLHPTPHTCRRPKRGPQLQSGGLALPRPDAGRWRLSCGRRRLRSERG